MCIELLNVTSTFYRTFSHPESHCGSKMLAEPWFQQRGAMCCGMQIILV
jgi:hypothetical protein